MTDNRRRLRRRDLGRIRRASYWAARMEAAETPAQRAAVAWDHLRARIAALPADRRPPAWEAVIGALSRISPDRGRAPRNPYEARKERAS